MIQLLIEFLNSPLGITVIASLVVMALNYIYGKKPLWSKYEGPIISAIKFAEKKIPDNADNRSLRRLDYALRYVLKVYKEASGKEANKKVTNDLKAGIQIVHNELEENGIL